MKRMVVRLLLVFACMGLSVAFAEDKGMSKAEKDQCLLASKNCQNATLSIQEKMNKLQGEIEKGNKVYTVEEIKKLEDKLKETEKDLDILLKR